MYRVHDRHPNRSKRDEKCGKRVPTFSDFRLKGKKMLPRYIYLTHVPPTTAGKTRFSRIFPVRNNRFYFFFLFFYNNIYQDTLLKYVDITLRK